MPHRACTRLQVRAVVVSLGVNELTRPGSLGRWRRALRVLMSDLRARLGDEVPVAFCGLPPVHDFPVLPQPLRAVLGLRARQLDRVLVKVAREYGIRHVPLPMGAMAADRPAFFAADGFHPSAAGYQVAAEALAEVLSPGFRTGDR
ncbi:GDSL-type esterase/lipase family protein [Streptomyces sp. TRM 70361]|uniref:GDSL-type esterase/lipase family protein n=1 Tax=Streptomyces sp. TRM 70361 TaxID=3116553 RepID=UPI002E7C3648|nr:GDSL-type esterase/lipase family protein [Streptomyces sp. TRM 70361]MEE1938205.1 GDSL-type esterase/lipase family protein [Streptomyces sp. TRM 70361]